ncbi:MAG TPA: copper resistance protein NlpE [Agriterribacter sp.]|nr:copper resistance protein NlpE [Agriterribacter sp.]
MKKVSLPLFALFLFVACNSGTEGPVPSSHDIDSALAVKTTIPGEPDATRMLVGVFSGVLPCADCKGIKTELTLYQDVANADNNSYTLVETYLGIDAGDTSFTSKGKWDVLKGIKDDSEASVFFLNYDKPDESRYFLKKSDSAIVMLDKDQNIIASTLNYTLRKQ